MEKLKILVVDDESRMRKLIKDFLEREGYFILEAAGDRLSDAGSIPARSIRISGGYFIYGSIAQLG